MNRKERRAAKFIAEYRGKTGTPAFEAEVERDAKLSQELDAQIGDLLLRFAQSHPTADATVVGPALLRRTAMTLMIGLAMDPDDVAEFMRESALACVEDVARARAMLRQGGSS